MNKKDIFVRLLFAMFIFALLSLIAATKVGYPCDDWYEVSHIERFDDVSGDKESVRTDLKYYVYTDQGVFQIEMSGINAYPYGLQLIGRDLPKTLRMKTRGARAEWFGMYPNIIEIVEE